MLALARHKEADQFYGTVHSVVRSTPDPGQRQCVRRLAGMLWSKQFYHYDVDKWLEEPRFRPVQAQSRSRRAATIAAGTTCVQR